MIFLNNNNNRINLTDDRIKHHSPIDAISFKRARNLA